MRFGDEGHIQLAPKELYALAQSQPLRLINDALINGTPRAFQTYGSYCAFLEAVSAGTGVHPRNLFIRGSCKIGYSIAPKPKVWTAMSDDAASDLDLAIVDAPYFYRIDDEVQAWEQTNRAHTFQGLAFQDYVDRRRDRQFNCCRDYRLPQSVCVHHQDTMLRIPVGQFCGVPRRLSAFVFKDWWSVRRRYEYDLRQLCERVRSGKLPEPPDEPIPRRSRVSGTPDHAK